MEVNQLGIEKMKSDLANQQDANDILRQRIRSVETLRGHQAVTPVDVNSKV